MIYFIDLSECFNIFELVSQVGYVNHGPLIVDFVKFVGSLGLAWFIKM